MHHPGRGDVPVREAYHSQEETKAESWQTHRSQLAMTASGFGMASRRDVEGQHQEVLCDRRQGGNLGMPLEPGECLEHGARPADVGRSVFPLACTT